MRHHLKKFFYVFLCATLVITMLPATAFGQTETEPSVTTEPAITIPETETEPSVTTEPAITIPETEPTLVTEPAWFQDVKAGDWFYDSVRFVHEKGLMNGTSDSPMLFSPNNQLKRGMIVTILWRQAGSPSVTGLENPFTDVPDGQWYSNAVIWAADNSIVQGIGGGLYDPNSNITREQLAVIVYRYAQFLDKVPEGSLDGALDFADAGLIADYAKDAVLFCVNNEIISGKPGSIFDPKGQATRAEAATILNRFIESLLSSPSAAEIEAILRALFGEEEIGDEGGATEPVE